VPPIIDLGFGILGFGVWSLGFRGSRCWLWEFIFFQKQGYTIGREGMISKGPCQECAHVGPRWTPVRAPDHRSDLGFGVTRLLLYLLSLIWFEIQSLGFEGFFYH